MQYGSGGYSGNQRLYTPSYGLQRSGPGQGGREKALPDIWWKASGVTTRPTSGLRLTVRHMDVPQYAGSQATHPLSQQKTPARLSLSDPATRPVQYRATSTRSSLSDNIPRRVLCRPQITTVPTATSAPKANRTMLPPLPTSSSAPEDPPREEQEAELSFTSSGESDSTSLEDSEEEVYSDDEEDAGNPPSRPGFESETEQITPILDVPFVPVSSSTATFPATLLQDHMQCEMEQLVATIPPSGLCHRVNNVVRAFSIHGPLNRDLLGTALNTVASLHPVLAARFQRAGDRLYMQLSPGPISVPLESPIVGHEKADILITNARRKPFLLPLYNDLVSCEGEGGEGQVMSIVSLANSNNSDDSDKVCSRRLSSPVKKSVTFGHVTAVSEEIKKNGSHLPVMTRHSGEQPPSILIRARLVQQSVHDATLVLSFPRIVCDYWSSCLFVQQLVDAYGKLEARAIQRGPNIATSRATQSRRSGVATRCGRREMVRPSVSWRELARPQTACAGGYRPAVEAKLSFQQVALRERQLLKVLSKERLWQFWDAMLTAIIRRQRGPNRVKVVPPVRIPSGLGERIPRVRPQTSRLRPLTGRTRPQTGRRRTGEMADKDTLTGPKTEAHFIKFDEEVCVAFHLAFPEDPQPGVREDDLLCLACLGAYVLLLGRCCRGWGEEGKRRRGETPPGPGAAQDPLHHYQRLRGGLRSHDHPGVVIPQPLSPRRPRRATMTGRLDLGSFLVGVEVSLRHTHPRLTQGLFGPLTNDVGVRVDLSSSETFVDLILALGKTLQSVRNHYHFPFSTLTDELGVPAGLPVRFSYLYRSDILQLSDPAHFYFPETAVGVKGHGLARLGSTCYLSPLCPRLDDSCHLELCLWEGYDSDGVTGVFLYQPQAIRHNLVEALGRELSKLMLAVAQDPSRPLSVLASLITPPFSPRHSQSRRTHH